jgi:hypothetical protein
MVGKELKRKKGRLVYIGKNLSHETIPKAYPKMLLIRSLN